MADKIQEDKLQHYPSLCREQGLQETLRSKHKRKTASQQSGWTGPRGQQKRAWTFDLSLCGLAYEFILCCSKWSWHVLCSYLSKMKRDFKTQLFKRICTQKPLLIMGTVLNRVAQVHSQWHICEAPLLALCQFSSCYLNLVPEAAAPSSERTLILSNQNTIGISDGTLMGSPFYTYFSFSVIFSSFLG